MITDALGQVFHPIVDTQRIVSLVPSTTETLCALGLEDKIAGITRYCVHPNHLQETKTIIGGTKQLNWKHLENLNPDIVIGNKEENTPAIFKGLRDRNISYFVAFPQTVETAIADISKLGTLFGTTEKAKAICRNLHSELNALKTHHNSFTYAYLIWRKPWMAVNQHTFIHSMISKIGGINIFREQTERYPTVTLDGLKSLDPDVIFLSSEPFSFNETHLNELKMNGFLQPIVDINGEYCSWHGIRMSEGLRYLQALKSEQLNTILS